MFSCLALFEFQSYLFHSPLLPPPSPSRHSVCVMGVLFAHHNCGSPETIKICHLCHVLSSRVLLLHQEHSGMRRERREERLFTYICTVVEWFLLVKQYPVGGSRSRSRRSSVAFVCYKLLIDCSQYRLYFHLSARQSDHAPTFCESDSYR